METIKSQVNKPINNNFAQGHLEFLSACKETSNETGKVLIARLRELRRHQLWLAHEVGVSHTAVSRWVHTGKISSPNIKRVSEVLGLSVGQIMGVEAFNPARATLRIAPASLKKEPTTALIRLSDEEQQLIGLYRACTDNFKNMVFVCADNGVKLSIQPLSTSGHK